MDLPDVLPLNDFLTRNAIARNECRRLVSEGHVHRVRHGAYANSPEGDRLARHLQLILGTLPQLTAGAVVSHASAAALHQLPLFDDLLHQVWLTRRDGGHGRSTRWLRVLHSPIADDEIDTIESIRVTSLARTALDLARSLPLTRAVAVLDHALRQGVDRTQLTELLARYPRRPGTLRARTAISLADPLSESVPESESRVVMIQQGIPAPTLQFEVRHLGVFLGRSDFAWEEQRLLGEFDGRVKYDQLLKPGQTPADVVMAEKRREQRLREAQWWVVRWGYDAIVHPEQLARSIRTGFRNAAAFAHAA
ncbi:MAG: hypothetical protein WAS07_08290 [Micropruina sp.]